MSRKLSGRLAAPVLALAICTDAGAQSLIAPPSLQAVPAPAITLVKQPPEEPPPPPGTGPGGGIQPAPIQPAPIQPTGGGPLAPNPGMTGSASPTANTTIANFGANAPASAALELIADQF